MNDSGLLAFLLPFFYINNSAFCETNSLGKTLDTRQQIFYAALVSCYGSNVDQTLKVGYWDQQQQQQQHHQNHHQHQYLSYY